MQLDRTHVAIRVRTLSEIGDLSLLLIRRYPRAYFHAFFLGAAFWIIADVLLLAWLPAQFMGPEFFEGEFAGERLRYLFWMMTLVFLQAPLAGIVTTYVLGQSIFEQQPRLSSAIKDIRPLFWRLIWTLGFQRMAIPAMLVVAFRYGTEAHGFYDAVLPITFLLIAAVIRSNRPFVAEMILLERCPLRSKTEGEITLRKRSKALHTPLASELGGRFLTVSIVLSVLMLCLFFALVWTRGVTLGDWSADTFAMLVFYPLALWLIASLSVVSRLLSYLDARIRLEGWEVELAIRAEAIRQFGQDFMSVPLKKSPPAIQNETPPTATTPAAHPMQPIPAAGIKTLILLAMCLAGCNTVAAAEPAEQPAPVVADSSWFDSSEQSLVPIELEDNRVDAKNRDSRWLPKPPKPKAAAPPPATTTSWWNMLSFWEIVGWMLLLLTVSGLVALLVYLFNNSSFDFRQDLPSQSIVHNHTLDEQTKQRIAELPAELRDTNVSPRTELERLMKAGDFDRAIIFLYGHQLLMLDRIGWLRLSRWKTNNQYVRETNQSHTPTGGQLGRTVKAFERSYFGKHSLSREDFETLWQENLVMEAAITNVGAAA